MDVAGLVGVKVALCTKATRKRSANRRYRLGVGCSNFSIVSRPTRQTSGTRQRRANKLHRLGVAGLVKVNVCAYYTASCTQKPRKTKRDGVVSQLLQEVEGGRFIEGQHLRYKKAGSASTTLSLLPKWIHSKSKQSVHKT